MTPSDKITIYTPESPLAHPVKLLREMLRDLRASRELAWRLFVRDMSAQYRQTLLGYVWAFLPPLATSITFIFLNSQNILSIRETTIPYPAFVLISTTLWQTFVEAINAPLKLVQSSRAMLAKINFPREALILAGLGEVLFNFAIRSLIVVFAICWFRVPISSMILLAPFGILCLIALGLMFGILLTPLGILYQDVGRGLTLITGFWMLLTPVVYPSPKSWPASLLTKWNPVSPIITTTRDWLTGGAGNHLHSFLFVVCVALVMLFLGWILYRLAMPHLIERMGG
jgi:lipopolysaccharide transport system permease protein